MTEEMLLEMIKGLTESYFLNQILIILALFLLGLVFLHITDEETGLRRILMCCFWAVLFPKRVCGI